MSRNILNKLNFVDLVIVIGVIIALFVGLCTVKQVRQTADKQIEATSPIVFQVFLRGVTVTGQDFPIAKDTKTFITIRNVPYTELEVLDVSSQTRKTYTSGQKQVLIDDPATPNLYDAIVTIKDVAKITKDGAVVGGNKIKMGLPVVLEGDKYKFNGIISDIRIKTELEQDEAVQNSNVG